MRIQNDVLTGIYKTGRVQDESGQSYPVNSQISLRLATALYRTVLQHKPKLVVEIGMAYGIATLAILTALRDVDEDGRVISIDPNQGTDWRNIGVTNVRRCGMAEQHLLIEEADYVALPALLRDGTTPNFAYIDGWHTFDYVMMDFFYLDKMLCPGGVIGFNDCGYAAIHKALNFVQTHRKYQEMDVGLKPDFRARNRLLSVARRILKRSNNDRYFQKQSNWEPAWNFYAHF